jgi:hypothetical protein
MGELARSNNAFASCVNLVCGLLAVCVPASAAQFAGGTGQLDSPYQIATAKQLISIGQDPNLLDKHFVLANDLDLNPDSRGGRVFVKAVIAPNSDRTKDFKGAAFTGCLDGKGHKIRHLTLQEGETSFWGLFGSTGRDAEIRNLILEDVRLGGSGSYIGGLVGYNHGRITNCRVTGNFSAGRANSYYVGLLAGANWGRIDHCDGEGGLACEWANQVSSLGLLVGLNRDLIDDCAARGTITAGGQASKVGGLIGENLGRAADCHASAVISTKGKCVGIGQYGGLAGANDGSIFRSYATGNVTCGMYAKSIGGLAGYNGGEIIACYATGSVSGEYAAQAGGLTGVNAGHIVYSFATGDATGISQTGGLVGLNSGSLSQCYSSGRIAGGEYNAEPMGGLVGDDTGPPSGRVTCSFWDTERSAMSTSKGGTGLTSAQMKDRRTFLTAGWDFAAERANGTANPWQISQPDTPPMLACLSPGYQRHKLEGTGTTQDPYKIADTEDLGAVWQYDAGACYRLVADVNLADVTWTAPVIPSFEGRFDGNGFTVSNLSFRGDGFLGLFGVLCPDAIVEKLQIEKTKIVAGDSAQGLGLLAVTNLGHIADCRVTGSILGASTTRKYADVVDENRGTITNCDPIGNKGPYTTIISDPEATRRFLKWESMTFDDIWIPADVDLQGLDETLREYLRHGTPIPARTRMDREYVLTCFRRYNREYSGFTRHGTKYIVCLMHLYNDRHPEPPRKEFTVIFDGGCGIVRVIYDARTKAVVSVKCNGVA